VLIATERGPLRTLLGDRAPGRPAVDLSYRTLEQRLASRPRHEVVEEKRFYLAVP
jgi:hypothetical protein